VRVEACAAIWRVFSSDHFEAQALEGLLKWRGRLASLGACDAPSLGKEKRLPTGGGLESLDCDRWRRFCYPAIIRKSQPTTAPATAPTVPLCLYKNPFLLIASENLAAK